MTKQKNSKKYLILVLIVLLLALGLGYAAFSDTLTITGTANASGSFDLQFTAASVTSSQGCTANATIGTDSNSDANDKITVTVQNLAYPGAGAVISATIENKGTINAKLTGITPTDITGNSSAIVISGLDQYATGESIAAGSTCTVQFTVYWDPSVTTLTTSDSNFSFNLELQYEQDTTPVTVTNTHTNS